jgi:hypothetical protein
VMVATRRRSAAVEPSGIAVQTHERTVSPKRRKLNHSPTPSFDPAAVLVPEEIQTSTVDVGAYDSDEIIESLLREAEQNLASKSVTLNSTKRISYFPLQSI